MKGHRNGAVGLLPALVPCPPYISPYTFPAAAPLLASERAEQQPGAWSRSNGWMFATVGRGIVGRSPLRLASKSQCLDRHTICAGGKKEVTKPFHTSKLLAATSAPSPPWVQYWPYTLQGERSFSSLLFDHSFLRVR